MQALKPYPILIYLFLFYRILFHPNLSFILSDSCLVLGCLVLVLISVLVSILVLCVPLYQLVLRALSLSCPCLIYHILSSLGVSCLIVSCRALRASSCLVLSCLDLSSLVLSCFALN